MQYDHGKRVTPHYHEMTPLERAITEFEGKAKAYHSSKNSQLENETKEQRAKREKQLESALLHLKHEKLRALTQVEVQHQLEEYRQAARVATEGDFASQLEAQEILADEKHHPTKKLANFMRMDGRPQPSPRFTPHHLVQGKGKGQDAARARVELHMQGIGVNDADNGVWMPRTKADKGHWAYPNTAAHSEIHTLNYEKWVYANVSFKASEQAMRGALSILRAHLKDGTQPEQVTSRSDPSWSGK
ncbi:AHH domain-containing protein [Microbulbifer sp. OS29]|uniref:AHH domain-containing protein n=1 Tax=Microbulbifer okhotskensis TaxID=2926617 RepID=A0A9X2J557_9GAMM|nr:AHH domain-containing protein [Microbulbifer okhotskensis]MCO1334004.1 AHH domain-containing protein [Microbulbifer okhotskensis]